MPTEPVVQESLERLREALNVLDLFHKEGLIIECRKLHPDDLRALIAEHDKIATFFADYGPRLNTAEAERDKLVKDVEHWKRQHRAQCEVAQELDDERVAALETAEAKLSALEGAARKGLEFAVMFIAFQGRDRGTSRLEGTLDGLETLALETDKTIRASLDSTVPAGEVTPVKRGHLLNLTDVEFEGRSMRPLGSWIKHPLVSFSESVIAAFQSRQKGK